MKNEDEHGRFMTLTPWIQPYLPKGSIWGMIQGVKYLLRQCLDPCRVKLELSPKKVVMKYEIHADFMRTSSN